MIIFLRDGYQYTGMHRYLDAFLFQDGNQFIFVKSIEDTNKYEDYCAIFGGFLPIELSKNTTIKRKYYTFCSPFGQADMSSYDFYSAEINILYQLEIEIASGNIVNSITPSESLAKRMNYLYVPAIGRNIPTEINEERYGYGFLGNNTRKHRNVVNQISAMSLLLPKEEIIVNQDIYKGFEDLFNCKITAKSLSNEQYFKEIATHRLNFQCSFSESFSYLTFEYCCVGVPSIVSPCVSWYPIKELVVPNVDNPYEITKAAQWILNDKIYYKALSNRLKAWAIKFNEDRKNELFEALNRIKDDEHTHKYA
jgi:hypothetical protein